MIAVVIFFAGLALALSMSGAWAVQLRTGQSGWIDSIWSFAVGIVGAAAALVPFSRDWPTSRQVLVATIALVWCTRLGVHIIRRTLRGGEDPRYQVLRDKWGTDFSFQLFVFLQLQAAAALVLVSSILAAARNTSQLGWQDVLGITIISVAVFGEALADAQLERFRALPNPKASVCEVGLWRYSRHPNYFFEWLAWLAYPVIAIGFPLSNFFCLVALAGPVFTYWLLVHVSGIPPLEAHMLRTRGSVFVAYQRRVSAFFPGPRNV